MVYRLFLRFWIIGFGMVLNVPISIWAIGIGSTDSSSDISEKAFYLSKSELRNLIAELAPKVNLFRDIWDRDPKAEFFGGTTRDFVYWVLKHFRNIKEKSEIERIKQELLSLPLIDIRKILHFESDVDIMTEQSQSFSELTAETYGIRKIDIVNFDRFDPQHEMGQNEINQGSIPTEKIRLGKNGIYLNQSFGDGLKEILSGHLSINIPDPEKYRKTHYVSRGLNHPLLLALRYIRNLAQDYLHRFGSDMPDISKQKILLPEASLKWVEAVVLDSMRDPHFSKILENSQIVKWLSGSIRKAFRGYSNPTAAFLWFQYFQVDKLQRLFPEKIPSLHEFLLIQNWNEDLIRRNWKKYQSEILEENVLVDPQQLLSDGFIYHGAGSPEAFRSLIFQGAIPSASGNAGRGFYGVPIQYLSTAERFAKNSGRKELIVKAHITQDARIVDISQGPGQKLFHQWLSQQPAELTSDLKRFDNFAEAFGFDIVVYPYEPLAVVVKNKRALQQFEGLHIQLLTLDKIYELARHVSSVSSLENLLDIMEYNHLNAEEIQKIFSGMNQNALLQWLNVDQVWQRNKLQYDFRFSKLILALKSLAHVGRKEVSEIILRALNNLISVATRTNLSGDELCELLGVNLPKLLNFISIDFVDILDNREFYQAIRASLERLSVWVGRFNNGSAVFIPPKFFYEFSQRRKNYFPLWAKNFHESFIRYLRWIHLEENGDLISKSEDSFEEFLIRTYFSETEGFYDLEEDFKFILSGHLRKNIWGKAFSKSFWLLFGKNYKASKKFKSLNADDVSKSQCVDLGLRFRIAEGSGQKFSLLEGLSLLSCIKQDPDLFGIFIKGGSPLISDFINFFATQRRSLPRSMRSFEKEFEPIVEILSQANLYLHKQLIDVRNNPAIDILVPLFKILNQQEIFYLWSRLKTIPFYQRFFAMYEMKKDYWISRQWNEILDLARSGKVDEELISNVFPNLDVQKKDQIKPMMKAAERNFDSKQAVLSREDILKELQSIFGSAHEVQVGNDSDSPPVFKPQGGIAAALEYLSEMFRLGLDIPTPIKNSIQSIFKNARFKDKDSSFSYLFFNIIFDAADLHSAYGFLKSLDWKSVLGKDGQDLNFFSKRSPIPLGIYSGADGKRTAGDLGIKVVEANYSSQLLAENHRRKRAALLKSASVVSHYPDVFVSRGVTDLNSLPFESMKTFHFFRVDPRAVEGIDFIVESNGQYPIIDWKTTWALTDALDYRGEIKRKLIALAKDPYSAPQAFEIFDERHHDLSFSDDELIELTKNLLPHRYSLVRRLIHYLDPEDMDYRLLEILVKSGQLDYELENWFYKYKDSRHLSTKSKLARILKGERPSLENLRILFESGFTFEEPKGAGNPSSQKNCRLDISELVKRAR